MYVCLSLCLRVCVCVCVCWFNLYCMCRYEVCIIAADLLFFPLRGRAKLQLSRSPESIRLTLLQSCHVRDKQTHMTDVNTIPTSPAVCVCFSLTSCSCAAAAAAELLSTTIHMQEKKPALADSKGQM